ncbi:hypothetical protein PVAP13_3KG457001 [Panicum virgatum]|uniref:Uncharacterized protein n=1 Tax=Panicum virgatum TaxID=38727 RepID=A0A8T0V9G4_PANVG|nr:hypothetical protein PVAP13_3KG457001 [Panicum virgatum]
MLHPLIRINFTATRKKPWKKWFQLKALHFGKQDQSKTIPMLRALS